MRFTGADAAPQNAERLANSRRRPSWRHGLDGDARRWRADPQALWPDAKSVIVLGLNYGPAHDPLAILGAKGPRRDLGLCPGRRLSRRGEEEAEGAGRLHLPRIRRRGESLRRHRAGDGKAAGAESRLGWQGKHTNLVSANSAPGCSWARSSPPWNCRPMTRGRTIIAAIAMPAWISAPPMPFPRPTGWMRGAAFPISPSRTRVRSRANSAKPWATASMAATIAWRCVPGTSSRRRPPS